MNEVTNNLVVHQGLPEKICAFRSDTGQPLAMYLPLALRKVRAGGSSLIECIYSISQVDQPSGFIPIRMHPDQFHDSCLVPHTRAAYRDMDFVIVLVACCLKAIEHYPEAVEKICEYYGANSEEQLPASAKFSLPSDPDLFENRQCVPLELSLAGQTKADPPLSQVTDQVQPGERVMSQAERIKFQNDGINSTLERDAEFLKASSPQPAEIVLVPDEEVAYDIWLFRKNRRTGHWYFAGIYQDGTFKRLHRQGYHKRYSPSGNSLFYIHDEGNLISEVIPPQLRDCIRAYVDGNQTDLQTDLYKVTYAARSEKLVRSNNSLFNDKALEGLPTHSRPILQDKNGTCYLPFRNGVVEVTRSGSVLKPYSILEEACLWKSQVIDRDYNPEASADCHFARFIANVANGEEDRKQAFRTATGYALHSHNRQSEGQAIICCDEELTDKSKPQGGTGKGVWVNGIMQMRPTAYVDGKKFDPNDKFCFQAINRDTRVVWIDDVKADFSLDRFFSVLTGGWDVEKKNQPSYKIPYAEGPKLIICTNTAPNNEGSSNIRRQFILEFGDFYKKRIKAGVKSSAIVDFHGCEFFTGWDSTEWERFDRFMVECVQEYLVKGLMPYQTRNVSKNRLLQTTSEEFLTWVTTYQETGLKPDQPYKRIDLLADYRTFAGLSDKEMPSRRFSDFIKRYSASQGWVFALGNSNSNPTFTLKNPS